MQQTEFTEYKNAFEDAHKHINGLEDNCHFDTNNFEVICDDMRGEVNRYFILRLNEIFTTEFVGTDAFYDVFGSLHEIDFDTLYYSITTYKRIIKGLTNVTGH